MSAIAPSAVRALPASDYEADAGMRAAPSEQYGRGLLCYPLIKTVASPAAGAEWSIVVPSGRTWIVRSIAFRFVSAAAVANRLTVVGVGDGTTTPLRIPVNGVQAASLTEDYCLVRNLGVQYTAGSPSQNALPLWREPVPGGFTISTTTQNIQAADQYSAISLYVIECRILTDNERAQLREAHGRGTVVDNYPGLLVGD